MEGQRIARLLVIGQGMSQQLALMAEDQSVPIHYRRAAKDLLRDWSDQGGKVEVPPPTPVIVLVESLKDNPEIVSQQTNCPAILPLPSTVEPVPRSPVEARVLRLTRYLRNHGPALVSDMMNHLGVNEGQLRYVLERGPFSQQKRGNLGDLWSVDEWLVQRTGS